MKKLLTVIALFQLMNLNAQDCLVSVPSLQGSYQGECKNKKADGKGTAKGEDEYTGEFKKGYPDGYGVYKWKNGNWFEGNFKKGMKEGKGTFHLHEGNDTLQTGFWKNDKYIGIYEHPYVVSQRSSQVTQVEVRKNKGDNLQDIVFSTQSVSGGALEANRLQPKVAITDIKVLEGAYGTMTTQDNMSITSITTLRNVQFPFKARIYFGSDLMEIEFYETGSWQVAVKIQR